MLSDGENKRKNRLVHSRPNTAQAAQESSDSSSPWVAAASASVWFFCPRRREISELTPTQVPTESEIMRICTGDASETAVSASGWMRET